MAKIRKLNVSEITGRSPFNEDDDAIMPAGTVVVYEKNNNGVIEYVLRVHDGVTNGGVSLGDSSIGDLIMLSGNTIGNGMAQYLDLAGPVRLGNDTGNIELTTVNQDTNTVYTWTLDNDGVLTLPAGGHIRETVVTDNPTIVITPASAESPSQSLYIKGGAGPIEPADYHLHLTTGDLTDTSIIVGTDDHNIRTTTDGGVEINTFLYPDGGGSAKWTFDNNGVLTLPLDGNITFPDGSVQTTAYTAAGPLYVIVNSSGEISTSSDGETWTTGTDSNIDNIERVAVGTSAIVYIAEVDIPEFNTAEDAIFYQTRVDGVINRVTQFELGAYNFNEVVWGGGRFVLVGHTLVEGDDPEQPVLFTSTNGQTWTATDIDPLYLAELGANEFDDVYYDGTGFLITATGGVDNSAGGFYVTDPTSPLGQNNFVPFILAGDGEPVYVEFEQLAYGGSGWIARAENDILHSFTGEFNPGGPPAEWTPLNTAALFKEFCGLDLEGGGEEFADIIELEGGVIGDTYWIIFTTGRGHVGATSDLGATWTFSIPQPFTGTMSFVTIDEGGITTIALDTNLSPGEKITISNSGIADLDGTYYVDNPGDSTNANILYTDSALTTPKISAQGGTPNEGNVVTRGVGEFLDAASILNGYMYVANDNEQIFRSTDGETWTKVDDQDNNFAYWNDIDYNPAFGGVTLGSASTGDITFNGVNIIGTAAAERFGLINLVPALTADDGFNNIDFLESGQFISIYPTMAFDAPHIHIAAGLGLDDAEGDLFLGDDNKYVEINHFGNVRIQSFDNETNNTYRWEFDNSGNLTLPVASADFGGSGQIFNNSGSNFINLDVQFNSDILGGMRFGTQDNTPVDIWAGGNGRWRFGSDGSLTIPGDIQSEEDISVRINLSDSTQRVWRFGEDGDLTLPGNLVLHNADFVGVSPTEPAILFPVPGFNGGKIQITENGLEVTAETNTWTFGVADGGLTFPDATVQTTAYVPDENLVKVSGEWAVTTGTNTYSFTVPGDGTYVMWVKGNIPNGIITWNATASVTNSNVPAIGTQYAWNYTAGGSPILLTSIPDQIKGVAGTISTDATYEGSTSNRFDFGISNTSGSTQTIYYGYTKIS